MLVPILLSIAMISLISLIGAIFLSKFVEKHLFLFVSFATGALLGVVFLDLLPETESMGFVLLGILVSFILEKILWWHHHHHISEHHKKHTHPAAHLLLIGDSIHNFIDGMVIASAYQTNFSLGVAVTLAIIFHEIPQELGDFGVFLASGLSRAKALLYNFCSALSAFLGGIIVYVSSFDNQIVTPMLLAFAAGNFLYIANVDLLPELHRERELSKSLQQLVFIVIGIGVIWVSVMYGKG